MGEFNELQNEKQHQWNQFTEDFKKLEQDRLKDALHLEEIQDKFQKGKISKKERDAVRFEGDATRIDSGLEPVLIGLWANNFETSASCFGHMISKEDRGSLKIERKVLMPFVLLGNFPPFGDGIEKAKDDLYNKIQLLIEEFYQHEALPQDNPVRLIGIRRGYSYSDKQVFLGTKAAYERSVEEAVSRLSEEDNLALLGQAQGQFKKFADFLKNKFFGS